MAKSSINIQPVKAGSEEHNLRLKEYDYVRQDLSHLNSTFHRESISSALERIKLAYQKSTGQKMQKKATPIREGVVLLQEHHTADDLVKLGQKLEQRFGIKLIQAYAHKDEGHWKEGVWHSNLHGHMVFDWTDEKGKSVKLNRYQMSEMQTLVAETLGMERGISSDKKHLSAVSFKVQEEEKRLKDLKADYKAHLEFGDKELTQYKNNDLLQWVGLSKKVDYPATLEGYKKSLQASKITLKEKDKEIRLLQNLELSRQKEMENLKRKISQREKDINALVREKQLLIFNKNYLQSIQQEWINILLKDLQKKYRLEIERAMKEYAQKNQEVILVNNPRFVYFVQSLKEDIFKEHQGKMQDLEAEISEVFDKEKEAIHQDIYDSVSERFRQEQILKQRQKTEPKQKIRKGRRF